MRRLYSENQVKQLSKAAVASDLAAKQAKLTAGSGISISSSNVISTIPPTYPMWTLLLSDTVNLAISDSKEYEQFGIPEIANGNLVIFTVFLDDGSLYSTAVCCNSFSDIPQIVNVPTNNGGKVTFDIGITSMSVSNYDDSATLEYISIYRF